MSDPNTDKVITSMINGLVSTGAPMAAQGISTPHGDYMMVLMTPEAYQALLEITDEDPRGQDPSNL